MGWQVMIGTLIEDFANEIQQLLKAEHIILPVENGTPRIPCVYAHTLPPSSKATPPLVPWVLVTLHEGEQTSATEPCKATLHITDMIYDDREDMQGYQDAILLIERICWHLYGQSFVAAKYEVAYPFRFAVIDDVRYPYFSAGLEVKVEFPGTAPEKLNGGYAYA